MLLSTEDNNNDNITQYACLSSAQNIYDSATVNMCQLAIYRRQQDTTLTETTACLSS